MCASLSGVEVLDLFTTNDSLDMAPIKILLQIKSKFNNMTPATRVPPVQQTDPAAAVTQTQHLKTTTNSQLNYSAVQNRKTRKHYFTV